MRCVGNDRHSLFLHDLVDAVVFMESTDLETDCAICITSRTKDAFCSLRCVMSVANFTTL